MTFKIFGGAKFTQLLATKPVPTVKGWNRLEGRPRTEDFDETLRAEVRDPLWMLARQHQLAEFRADDAGSPAFAKVKVATTHIDRFQVGDASPGPYDEGIPLEARVERRPLPATLDLSLQIGRYWLRLLARARAAGELSQDYAQAFKGAFPFAVPTRGQSDAPIPDHQVLPHQEVWQLLAAAAGRAVDGLALAQESREGGDILEDIAIAAGDEPVLRALEQRLLAWLARQYSAPAQEEFSAWAPSYLEYRFACAAPDYHDEGQIVLIADEYHGGHLDWYAFDIHPSLSAIERPEGAADRPPDSHTFNFIPTIIEFGGMPNARWWEFEDRKTDFGSVDAHTTDLARLLLIEFALIYANDWFLLPFEVPVGTLARIEGLAVTNVFGERIWIEAAGSGADDDWQRWAMFNLSVRGEGRAADRSIFVPPAVDRLQESRSVEEVHFIRDEMANLVWGVESRVMLANGAAKDGFEVQTELVSYLKSLLPPTETGEPAEAAPIRYVLMTSVPENWIPFIPVRMPGGATNREIQLQRAATLRILDEADERPRIRPRTEVLRHNLDGSYFIHEEEVPRAGAHVLTTFQRARWHDGSVCVWLGNRKRTGRGEGSSGLRFDQIEPVVPRGGGG